MSGSQAPDPGLPPEAYSPRGSPDGKSRGAPMDGSVRPTCRSRKSAERRPGNRPAIRLQLARTIRHIFFLPDAKGAIRGTFAEGRTGRQHEREEGAETVIRFSPLIVFPPVGPALGSSTVGTAPGAAYLSAVEREGKRSPWSARPAPLIAVRELAGLHGPLAASSVLTAFTEGLGPQFFGIGRTR